MIIDRAATSVLSCESRVFSCYQRIQGGLIDENQWESHIRLPMIFDRNDENMESEARTRQIIRYRATATLRRPQIKQYTASKEGVGLQNKREHHMI